MAAAVEKIQMLADDSGLEKTNFAFAHSVGRSDDSPAKQDAQAWMDRIRPEYAKLLAFQQLEAKINDLPCPALCGTATCFDDDRRNGNCGIPCADRLAPAATHYAVAQTRPCAG